MRGRGRPGDYNHAQPTLPSDPSPEHGGIRRAPPEATIAWLPQEPPDPAESLLAYTRRRTGVAAAAADAELHAASSALSCGMP
ncbi:MAG: hypothetical protein L0H79_16405, partial [Intrasporangium sp.]|nr:hypothetical protein [Intrasporangium sp.]